MVEDIAVVAAEKVMPVKMMSPAKSKVFETAGVQVNDSLNGPIGKFDD